MVFYNDFGQKERRGSGNGMGKGSMLLNRGNGGDSRSQRREI